MMIDGSSAAAMRRARKGVDGRHGLNGRLARLVGVLAGISLGIGALTNYRWGVGFGLGEVGLVLATALALLPLASGWRRDDPSAARQWTVVLLIYVVAVLTLITLVQAQSGVVGASMRDLVAYLLAALFVAACAYGNICVRTTIVWLLAAYVVSNLYHLAVGPEQAWYYGRYTGGAKNPNQMALYSVLCMTALSAVHTSVWIRLVVTAFTVYIGLKTSSDAFVIFLLVYLTVAAAAILVPYRRLPVLAIPGALLGAALWIALWTPLSEEFSLYAQAADEGGSRFDLAANGLRAWVDTPFSVLFGNGAGAFSGLYGPFEGAEAHNTLVDILSIGGIFGAALAITPHLLCVRRAYQAGKTLALAALVGLLLFSMFHYVGRQPMYWFVLSAALAAFAKAPLGRPPSHQDGRMSVR